MDDGGGFPEYLYAKPLGCTMFSIEKDERLTPPSSSEDSDEESASWPMTCLVIFAKTEEYLDYIMLKSGHEACWGT